MRHHRGMATRLLLALVCASPAVAAEPFTCTVTVELTGTPVVVAAVGESADAAEAAGRVEVCAKLKAETKLDCADEAGVKVWKARASVTTTITNGVKKTAAEAEMRAASVRVGKGTATAATRELACPAAQVDACRKLGGPCPATGMRVTHIDGLATRSFLRPVGPTGNAGMVAPR